MIAKLWARFYLWRNGFCMKHMVKKDGIVYDGGVCEWCPQCESEEHARDRAKVASALKVAR